MSAFNIEDEDDNLLKKYLIDEIINTFIRKPMTMFALCNEVHSQIHAYELSLPGNNGQWVHAMYVWIACILKHSIFII